MLGNRPRFEETEGSFAISATCRNPRFVHGSEPMHFFIIGGGLRVLHGPLSGSIGCRPATCFPRRCTNAQTKHLNFSLIASCKMFPPQHTSPVRASNRLSRKAHVTEIDASTATAGGQNKVGGDKAV